MAPAVDLHYTAPAACPARAAMESAIRERSPAVELAAGAAHVITIDVEAAPDGGYAGTVSIDGAVDKTLAAEQCEDLVPALALVTSLAIDALASPAVEARRPVAPVAARHVPVPWELGAAADLGVRLGITPDALVGGGLEGRAVRGHGLELDLALLAGHDSSEQDMGTASFLWLAGRGSACWRFERAVAVAGCADLEAGLVRAVGEDIILGRAIDRPWAAAGVHAALEWPVRGRSFGQFRAGATFPFTRDRYVFQPAMSIHETAAVVGWVALGVGVRFR
jgi:hypothetical protein